MLPAKLTKKFAVTNPRGSDAAMYSVQTNSLFLAWLVWRIVQRGNGNVISAATGKTLLPYSKPLIKN